METQTLDPDVGTRDAEKPSDTDSLTHLVCSICRKLAEQANKQARTFCGLWVKKLDYIPREATSAESLCIVCRHSIGKECTGCGHPLRFKDY